MSGYILENDGQGHFTDVTSEVAPGLQDMGLITDALWQDIDQDGDMDLVVGNHGLNSRFKASLDKPVSMWINDFDRNGPAEQIISVYNGKASYPLVLWHDLVIQMPSSL